MRIKLTFLLLSSILTSPIAVADNHTLTCMSNYSGESYTDDAKVIENEVGVTVIVKSAAYNSNFIGDLDHASDAIGVSFNKSEKGFLIDSSSSPAEFYLSEKDKAKEITLTNCN
ncbi:hypothetical protein [Enterobacter ludwigii]|uniref:hypothetical protein n=1 Tax=Enterobacter ludwigii TaxID=299767 RepID=UPI0039759EC6